MPASSLPRRNQRPFRARPTEGDHYRSRWRPYAAGAPACAFQSLGPEDPVEVVVLAREYGAVPVSARAATGLAGLLERVDELLFEGGYTSALAEGPRDAVRAI